MRLIIATNDLFAINGHAFNLALGLREELRRLGHDGEVWCQRDLDPALVAELQARTAFAEPPVGKVRPDSPNAGAKEWLRRAWAYRNSLRAARDGPGDPIFVTNAQEAEVLGLALWLATTRGPRPRALLVHFMIGPTDPARAGTLRRRYAVGLRLLRLFARRTNIVLSTGSAELSSEIGRLAGRAASVRPMAKVNPEVAPRAPRGPGEPLVVGVLGTPRRDKGLHMVPGIARRVAEAGLRCHFEVHATHMPRWATPAELAALQGTETVEFEVAALSREAYWERVARADIVLLPYERESFATRTSGIFAEAASLGIPAVAPAGTWTGNQIEDHLGSGTVFASWNEDSIARALADAIRRLPELRVLADQRAEAWRTSHGMAAFVETLLADVEASSQAAVGRR